MHSTKKKTKFIETLLNNIPVLSRYSILHVVFFFSITGFALYASVFLFQVSKFPYSCNHEAKKSIGKIATVSFSDTFICKNVNTRTMLFFLPAACRNKH